MLHRAVCFDLQTQEQLLRLYLYFKENIRDLVRQDLSGMENRGSYTLSPFSCIFLHPFTTIEESWVFTVEIIKIVRVFCNIKKLVATLLCFIKKVLLTQSQHVLSSD